MAMHTVPMAMIDLIVLLSHVRFTSLVAVGAQRDSQCS